MVRLHVALCPIAIILLPLRQEVVGKGATILEACSHELTGGHRGRNGLAWPGSEKFGVEGYRSRRSAKKRVGGLAWLAAPRMATNFEPSWRACILAPQGCLRLFLYSSHRHVLRQRKIAI